MHPEHHCLEVPAEQALFNLASVASDSSSDLSRESLEKPLDGIIALFHSNERPLQGLAGVLDWYFHGAISSFLRTGVISGNPGEHAYLPLVLPRHSPMGRTFHLLLLGAGSSPTPGARVIPDDSTFTWLQGTLRSLKLSRMAVSRADFGGMSCDAINKKMKETPLWIVQ